MYFFGKKLTFSRGDFRGGGLRHLNSLRHCSAEIKFTQC